MATHLVAFYAATSGVNGSSLGSDEEDIVLIQYLIWDIGQAKILTEQQYLVRPSGADVNENLLSENCREEYGLAEEQVKSGQSIDSVIDSFDAIVKKLCDDGHKVNLITDGQLHLRQVLHPKAVAKGIELPLFYHNFFDIRKEFKSFYHLAGDIFSIKDMVEYLEMKSDSHTNLAVRSVRDISKVINRIVNEGHRFAIPEVINTRLEPGICTRSEEVDSGCVVRARGLPWQSSDQDIAKFFRGLNIAKGGVALCLSPQGRRNGEALVRFVSGEHRDMALKRHKHHIGNRYIEVYKATGEDFINVAGGNNNEAQQFLSKGGQVIIRMRGLPYDCTAKQVCEFFEIGECGCDILDGEEGVLFVRKPDGRATGDAFVLFSKEEDSAKALAKHREIIGSRYIELFRSTTAEVQQVLNRSMDPRTFEQQQPLIGQLPQMPMIPQQFITTSNRKDCIRLRGLPYEALVENVLDFLGEHAKDIVFRGVHMVINAQGQPSGEAFIQMNGEQSAYLAAQNRHHRYMVFGKKQRYIEVFQCSGEDMNLVLSGGLPTQRAVASPGMLMWDQSVPTSQTIHAGAQRSFVTPIIPYPSSVQPMNGAIMTNIMASQIKPEQMLIPNSMIPSQIRPPTIIQQQSPLEMPHVSQAQATTLLSPIKQHAVAAPQATAIHPSLLSQYGDFNLAAAQGLVLFPGATAAKIPFAAQSFAPQSFAPQMSFMGVSSAIDPAGRSNLNLQQPKYTLATTSLLPMPYVAPGTAAIGAGPHVSTTSSSGKRSFDRAFTGESGHRHTIKKRPPPPRFASPNASSPHLNTHIPPPQFSAQLNSAAVAAAAVAAQSLGTVSMAPPMITTLYPPPTMYPPTM